MANKVEIIVVAKDMTGPVFDEVERKAKAAGDKTGKSFSTSFEKSGKDAGASFAKGIEAGMGSSGGGDKKSPFASSVAAWVKDAADAGVKLGGTLIQGIGQAFVTGQLSELIRNAAIGALAGTAVIAAPLIASMAAGIIAGAGVLLAAFGGVFAAIATSNELQSAGKELGDSLMSGLRAATDQLDGPILQIMDKIKASFQGLAPTLENLFGNIAPLLDDLANGGLNFVDNFVKGIDVLVEKAGPDVMAGISAGLTDLGGAFQEAFEILAETEGLGEGIHEAFLLIGDAIVFVANVASIGAEAWNSFYTSLEAVSRVLEADGLAEKAEALGDAIKKILLGEDLPEGEGVEGKFIHLKDGITEATAAAARWNEAIAEAAPTQEKLIEFGGEMTSSLQGYEKAVDNVASKQEKFNEAVAQYGADSPEAALAGTQLADAIQKQADAAQAAVGAYQGWTPELQAWAEAAGLSAQEIDTLKASLDNSIASAEKFAVEWTAKFIADTADANAKTEEAQQKVTAYAKTWTAKIVAENADALAKAQEAQAKIQAVAKTWTARIIAETAQAMSNIGGVAGAINALPSSKTITVNVVATGAVGLAGLKTGGSVGMQGMATAASGGIRGNMVLVGEEGPEVVRLPYGSTVIPHGQSKQMLETRTTEQPRSNGMNNGTDWQEVLFELRRLGDRIGGMTIKLDSRVLGAIQGRESDLRYRAG